MTTVRLSGSRKTTSQQGNGQTVVGSAIILQSTLTNIEGKLSVGPSYSVNATPTNTVTQILINSNNLSNVANPDGYQYTSTNVYGTVAERITGAVYIPGGVGIEKDLSVGGFIYGRISKATTSSELLITTTNVNNTFYPVFARNVDGISGQVLFGDNQGVGGTTGAPFSGLTYNPANGLLTADNLYVPSTASSTSTTTGAIVVNGGIGVAENVVVGKELLTNFIASKMGNINMTPNEGLFDVFSDIRVRGTNPIGTAPVVTNILYVTIDGDDTNDGRAMDTGRACRTITGAVNSPYYQPGTQIRVAPGHYLEDNPIPLKPYTSVMGADLRTTSVEPINKTQDLFHVQSGNYLAFMQFTNGRSGLLEGPYLSKFNRGAYCVAFPPNTGEDRIDLFHSPYVQNCTNQSGPWLKDGTMFVPDYTVQVPVAVGTGTWNANTTSIVVNMSQGAPVVGMAINDGQQNPGFFNARTLMLANKMFLQEQVVAWINDQIAGNTGIWIDFVYNQALCYRDVGILVENVSYDMAFGGNEKSVQSGLAYYNGVISRIAGQEQQTTAAIDYLKSLIVDHIIINDPVMSPYTGSAQVINFVLTGGEIGTDSVNNCFDIINDIINNTPSVAPPIYVGSGPDAAYMSAEILLQSNRKFIQEQTINYINNNLRGPGTFAYNQIKCARDTGLVIDSVITDMLYPTAGFSQSTFAGYEYYAQNGYTGAISSEIVQTKEAINYLGVLAAKIVQNVTQEIDAISGISRYSNSVQLTSTNCGTVMEAKKIKSEFDIILEILNGTTEGWTDRITSPGLPSDLGNINNSVSLLQDNKSYLQDEVSAYITSPSGLNFTDYDDATCRRDIGYIIDSICFDLRNGGNRQAIQSGLYYYTDVGGSVLIPGETVQTVAAFNFLASMMSNVIQNIPLTFSYQYGSGKIKQNVSILPAGTTQEANRVIQGISTVTSIISAGPAGYEPSPISLSINNTNGQYPVQAFKIIEANKEYLIAEMLGWIEQTYNPNSFRYDQAICYRDTGLIVDAVSQDILLGGNSKTVEAGLSYWNQGYNYVSQQITTTTMAIQYARDISLQIIDNQSVTIQPGTVANQVINPFFQYGGDYMPRQAVARNYNTIVDIIQNGPALAPKSFQGSNIKSATGVLANDIRVAPEVIRVDQLDTYKYLVGLSTSTVGSGTNSTLYFGSVSVYPKLDPEVEALSIEYTQNTSTWNSRKLDPIGAIGGALVDGGVISSRSPIQSFVFDAFTQVSQGGRGVRITNDGYAQLVSVFTIFCSVGVQVDNGGIASIVNSNDNFGDICLLAKGYGERKFSGTVYNPAFRAYPFSPPDSNPQYPDGLDQYYPNGFWPNNGNMEVFVPDLANRPHIGLVMEVVAPEGHINEQGFPGFLSAVPNTGTITTGSITISGINTDGISVGNALYIRDYYNNQTGTNSLLYADTGTVVTDIGYQTVTLNQPLTSGGGVADNPTYFNLYFCGNGYYTVLSSVVANNPTVPDTNILSPPNVSTPGMAEAHVASLVYMNSLIDQIVSNQTIGSTYQNTVAQAPVQYLVAGGDKAITFIDIEFQIMKDIIGAASIEDAKSVVPANLITSSGAIPQGAGSAVTLITSNIEFLKAEVSAYVKSPSGLNYTNYNEEKCRRDIALITQQLIYDLETGGNYNAVYSGLSYWSRTGTHHIITLGENATRTDLFPDGSTVNFFQRSYMSASGYVFEYVGAGTNYGALPQVGVADPVQGKEVVQLDNGKVFYTSTDQNGDFRIGPGLVISQATGVLSGRTFTKSLFANMTPFILAIEG